MFNRCVLFLWLACAALAQPHPKTVAMVLSVRGNPDVLTGQLWSAGDHIEMPAGAKITVLLLNKGQRMELSGKGNVAVSEQGLQVRGTTAKELSSTQVRLSLNGENQRQIGGMTLRNVDVSSLWNSPLERVDLSSEGITVSRPVADGAPPRLLFVYREAEAMPTFTDSFQALLNSPVPADSVFSTEVSGLKVGTRWQWQAPWPLEDAPKAYALRVFQLPSKKLLLLTRLYRPVDQEVQEMLAARQQAQKWAEREPRSAEPWVYLATVAEDKGRLEEALAAVQRAMGLRPADLGLAAIKVRLLLDLGRYRQAWDAKPRVGSVKRT